MKIVIYLLFNFFVLFTYGQGPGYINTHKTVTLMGSQFDITVVAVNEELGDINIDEAIAEITRIEKIISSWDKDSETSLINKNAGIKPVKVSYELFKLIERAKQISELTDGAFDISYASIDEVWRFDGSMQYISNEEQIKRAVAKVGYDKIILDPKTQTVFLKQKGMKISFGALGKGYAVDKAKALLISKQVVGGIINASGDITTWGTKATGSKWLVGIANPMNTGKLFSWIPIVESSMATSGNYEKYITYEGKKYSHIINPQTGYPISGINNVSIFAKSAEFSDALATAVFVMGVDSGLFLINQLDGVEAVLVDSNNVVHKTNGILF